MVKDRVKRGMERNKLQKLAHERNPNAGVTYQVKSGQDSEDVKMFGPAHMNVSASGGTKHQQQFPEPPKIEKSKYKTKGSSRKTITFFDSQRLQKS